MGKSLLVHKIEKALYHGGDLTGKNILSMFNNTNYVFASFYNKLIQSNDRSKDTEIKKRCDKTMELCILLDYIFSLTSTPSGKATPRIIATTRACVTGVIRKWRDLRLSMRGPKVCSCEDHLASQMIQWLGIECFTEVFIEQSHQTGMLEEKRTSHMSNRAKAAFSHSKSKWSRTMEPSVKLEIDKVTKVTKRKQVNRKDQLLGKDSKKARKKKRMDCHTAV